MSQPWQLKNPLLFEKEKSKVEAAYPTLHFSVTKDIVFVRGTFPVAFEGDVHDRYSIEIELPTDFPASLPIVREVGGRIPCIQDRHINLMDRTACVLLPDERWRVWPEGSPLLDYINNPLRNFFLGQSLVELGEPWPFGQWGHGDEGILQYYGDLLSSDNMKAIMGFLAYLAGEKVKGHWQCPCQSGKRLRNCHMEKVKELREKIPRKYVQVSLQRLYAKYYANR